MEFEEGELRETESTEINGPGRKKLVRMRKRKPAGAAGFDEAGWDDVLQGAANDLGGGDDAELNLIGGGHFVFESDAAILEADNGMLGDGHAKDVRGEVFDSGEAAAGGLGVDHPI